MFRKKNYQEKYRCVLEYLQSKEQEIALIKDLEKYHQGVLLDEKVLKCNGIIPAILKFYYDDTKEQLILWKMEADDMRKKEIKHRIDANSLAIKELENLAPVFNEILYYQNQKTFLEKKMSQKEIDAIYASLENKELTTRKH